MSETQIKRWQWEVDVPLQAIWQAMADTARFNEAAGLPKHEIAEHPQPDGSVLYLAEGRVGPLLLRWREVPVNWVREQWFEHRREFFNGPLRCLYARFYLEPTEDGCRVTVEVEAAARNLAGWVMLKTRFWTGCEKMYGDRIFQACDHGKGLRPDPFAYVAPKPGPGAAARGAAAVARIEATGHGHGRAADLLGQLFDRQEVDLIHLQPLAFAREKGLAALQAIELFLEATREGLLDMRWDLLCPRCRVPKATAARLDALPHGAHCGTCNIDYDSDFSKNVELSFSPAPGIRPVQAGEYCLFGPLSTPHILLHLTLAPGEVREVAMTLPESLYRWRTLEAGPETELSTDGAEVPRLLLLEDEVALGEAAPPGRILLENRSGRPLTAILEELTWARDALTADRVTSLQTFRDLFSDQVLRPGDEVAIRRIALLFSDLKGSTALYTRVGDAAAYHLVREHFAYLAAIVRAHEGAVVKTIGDAVMASFVDPQKALEAALEIQERVAEFNAGLADGRDREAGPGPEEALIIKLGLHEGPAIAVTLNDQLDYFGQTVNMAARLQGESQGGDIVFSESFADASTASDRLTAWRVEREQTTPKGFDSPVGFYRAVLEKGDDGSRQIPDRSVP